MRLIWATALSALVGSALVGCGAGGTSPAAPRTDGSAAMTYVVKTVTEAGQARPLVKGSQIRVTFDGGRITISAGCNTMSGTYRLAGSRLRVHGLATTDMGCPEALMAQDSWIAGLFAAPATLVTGQHPSITARRTVLTLVDRRVASPDRPLVGQRWLLAGLTNAATASSAGAQVFLQIDAGGTARIDERCTWLTADATVEGDAIIWGPLTQHPHSCPYSKNQGAEAILDRAVRHVLTGTTTATVVEKSLTITRGADGLMFTAYP